MIRKSICAEEDRNRSTFRFLMILFGFLYTVLCFDAKNALIKEWDVHKGTSIEYQDEILYSFEFHMNKTSDKTIITLWKSNEETKIDFRRKTDSRFAQFEISYDSDNSGTFISKSDEKPTSFSFIIDDFSQYSTNFLYANFNYHIIFISQKVIEIAISDMLGNDVDQYVAFAVDPIEVVKADPQLEKIIDMQSTNMPPSEIFVLQLIIKTKEFISKNKTFIYFALIIFGFQITLYMIFRCIKSYLSPKATTKSTPKAKRE